MEAPELQGGEIRAGGDGAGEGELVGGKPRGLHLAEESQGLAGQPVKGHPGNDGVPLEGVGGDKPEDGEGVAGEVALGVEADEAGD